ncbi:MAG TPA: hypothetical protein VE196_04590 [Pseudonocardiaceae bacterium]|nr:hypothetical protein [Pseudonocardiaceae bacterium]
MAGSAAGPDLAVVTQAAFELRPAIDIRPGIGWVGQHVVHGVVGRRAGAEVLIEPRCQVSLRVLLKNVIISPQKT